MRIKPDLKYLPYSLYLLISAIGGIAASAALLGTPASEKNRVLGNFSALQLLVAGANLLAVALLLIVAWNFARGSARLRGAVDWLESRQSRWLGGVILGIVATWVLFSLSTLLPYSVSPYLDRLKFQMVWLQGMAAGWLVLWLIRNLFLCLLAEGSRLVRASLLWLVGLALPGFIIWATGIGMDPRVTDPPAVRFSYTQLVAVVLATCIAAILIRAITRKDHPGTQARWLNFTLLAAIWLTAVVIWSRIDFNGSYNALGPYPPIGDLVPFADSIRFDLPGQTALVGSGFDRGLWVDNPMYSLFLMILRGIAGQEYQRVVFLQLLVMALTPVMVFLIGKELGSVPGGLAAALLAIVRDANILSQIKDHFWLMPVKVMATEPLVTLILATSIYFMIRWLKDPNRQVPLYLSGALFGISTLVRHNTWFFLPILFLVVLLRQWKSWRNAIAPMLLLGAFIGAAILPWMWRTQQIFGSPFFMVIRFTGMMEARYPGQIERAPEPQGGDPSGAAVAKIAKPVQDNLEQSPVPESSVLAFLTGHLFYHYGNSYYLLPGLHLLPGEEVLTIFPKQLHKAWRQADLWVGGLYIAWWAFLTWLVALGLVNARRHAKLAGLLPLLFMLAYALGNVAAGTSGSRYSQPFDWVILTYMAIGFFSLIPLPAPVQPNGKTSQIAPAATNWKPVLAQALPIWLGVLLVGALPLIADGAFPPRYSVPGQGGSLPQIVQAFNDPVLAFRSEGIGSVTEGRLIWPMFNKSQENNPFTQDTFNAYDRLTFRLVGDPSLPGRGRMYILTLGMDDWPGEFLAGKDALVLVCPNDPEKAAQVNAIALLIEGEPAWISSTLPCLEP